MYVSAMPRSQTIAVPSAKREIGRLIAEAMAREGWTPETLGPKLGVGVSTVRAYRDGKHMPKMDTMTRICLTLGIAGDAVIAAAGMPLVPHRAAEIQGLIDDLLWLRANRPAEFASIASLAHGLRPPPQGEDQ